MAAPKNICKLLLLGHEEVIFESPHTNDEDELNPETDANRRVMQIRRDKSFMIFSIICFMTLSLLCQRQSGVDFLFY